MCLANKNPNYWFKSAIKLQGVSFKLNTKQQATGSKTSDLIKTKSCFLFKLKVFLKKSRKLPRQTILKIISTHIINNFVGDTGD